MRFHVELPVTSMSECERDNTKLNTPAPHSHLRPCNTNKSHDTGEGKLLIGHSLDNTNESHVTGEGKFSLHLGVYSLLLPAV